MFYTVTKPLIVVRDELGAQHMFYEGASFSSEGLDKDHVEQLEEEGFIEEREEPELPENAGDQGDGAPTKSASKGDWEAYARSQGATDEDLDGLTKDELVAKYGD